MFARSTALSLRRSLPWRRCVRTARVRSFGLVGARLPARGIPNRRKSGRCGSRLGLRLGSTGSRPVAFTGPRHVSSWLADLHQASYQQRHDRSRRSSALSKGRSFHVRAVRHWLPGEQRGMTCRPPPLYGDPRWPGGSRTIGQAVHRAAADTRRDRFRKAGTGFARNRGDHRYRPRLSCGGHNRVPRN